MRTPSEDEARMAHVIAYNYAEAHHQPKVGAPRINTSGCNLSHRPTTYCPSCFWQGCQYCGKQTAFGFSGWTDLCDDHKHMKHMVRKVPDGSEDFYIKDDSSSGTAASVGPSTGSSATASVGPATGSSATASVGPSTGSVATASAGPATGSSATASSGSASMAMGGSAGPSSAAIPQPSAPPAAPQGGSSKGKNRAVSQASAPMAAPFPLSSPSGASSSHGSSSDAPGSIKIKPDPDAIMISSGDEDESPDAAIIRKLQRSYPRFPIHYEPPGAGESVYTIRKVTIGTGSTPRNPALTAELHDLFMKIENGKEESKTYPPQPPFGFNRFTPAFSMGDAIRIQHFGQEEKFFVALQEVKARNQERPIHERVYENTIVDHFTHGTSKQNAQKIVDDGIRQDRSSLHRFGKGVYGSGGWLMNIPVSYAFGHSNSDPALLLCDLIVGRAANTDGRSDIDVPPPGYDSVGSGNKWVQVAMNQAEIRYKYIVTIHQERDFSKWEQQLKDIKDRHAKMLEEKEAKAKAKTAPKQPTGGGSMDLSGLMASVDADVPPNDPSTGAPKAADPSTGAPKDPSAAGPSSAKPLIKRLATDLSTKKPLIKRLATDLSTKKPPAKRLATDPSAKKPTKRKASDSSTGGATKRSAPSSSNFVVNANGMSASISITGGASVTVTNGNSNDGGKKRQREASSTKALSKNTRVKFTVGGGDPSGGAGDQSGGAASSSGAGASSGGASATDPAGGSSQDEGPYYKTTPEDTDDEEPDDSDDEDWA